MSYPQPYYTSPLQAEPQRFYQSPATANYYSPPIAGPSGASPSLPPPHRYSPNSPVQTSPLGPAFSPYQQQQPTYQPPPHPQAPSSSQHSFRPPNFGSNSQPSTPRLHVQFNAGPSYPPLTPPAGPSRTSDFKSFSQHGDLGALGLAPQQPATPQQQQQYGGPPITITPAPAPSAHQYKTSQAPNSAPPALPSHFGNYTPRYFVKMENTQGGEPLSPTDRYNSTTPNMAHAPAPNTAPASGAAGEMYSQTGERPSHFITSDYSDMPPILSVSSVGPSLVSLLELGTMSGHPGSEFLTKCEITSPPELPSPSGSRKQGYSHMQSPTNGSYMQQSRQKPPRVVRLAFGEEGIQTSVNTVEHAQPGGALSHIVTLRGQVPVWSSVSKHARGSHVGVRIEVIHDGEMESYLELGDFKYESFATAPQRVPSYNAYQPSALLSHNPLKRSGTPLEMNRPAPGQSIHRRAVSSGMPKYETDMSQQGMYGQPVLSPTDYNAPNTSWSTDAKTYSGAEEVKPSGPLTQPNLQRATQIPGMVPLTAAYSPVTKATLDLGTDLPNMARGWSAQEWQDRRRLVQFWRRQTGTSITAICHPITQAKWQDDQKTAGGGIVVSCIYREETNMCYITSVDAIYLLEALVGSRFTVEEKNRIRRNLEGFRPITVSKTKPGSEEFFKLIMSFPNPKPRNIEKDVKVFPWDVIGQALKKIIGKYSASWQSGSPSPALSASSQLPPYGAPYQAAPTPLMPMEPTPPSNPYGYEDVSYDSAPPGLTSGPSSESIAYPQSSSMFSLNGPTTPHLHQGHQDAYTRQHGQPSTGPHNGVYHDAYGYGAGHAAQEPESPTQHTHAYAQTQNRGHPNHFRTISEDQADRQGKPGNRQLTVHTSHLDPTLAVGPDGGSYQSSNDYSKISPIRPHVQIQPIHSPGGSDYYGSAPPSATHGSFFPHSQPHAGSSSMLNEPVSPTPRQGSGSGAYNHGVGQYAGPQGPMLAHSTKQTAHGESHSIQTAPSVTLTGAMSGSGDEYDISSHLPSQVNSQVHSRETSDDLRVSFPTMAQ